MEKRTPAWEARRNFGKILREVADKENSYVIERHGEAVAAMVPMYVYDAWLQSQRSEFVRLALLSQKNANLTEEEANDIATEAVRAVRAEMRAERESALSK